MLTFLLIAIAIIGIIALGSNHNDHLRPPYGYDRSYRHRYSHGDYRDYNYYYDSYRSMIEGQNLRLTTAIIFSIILVVLILILT